jgi:hypothetical protein
MKEENIMPKYTIFIEDDIAECTAYNWRLDSLSNEVSKVVEIIKEANATLKNKTFNSLEEIREYVLPIYGKIKDILYVFENSEIDYELDGNEFMYMPIDEQYDWDNCGCCVYVIIKTTDENKITFADEVRNYCIENRIYINANYSAMLEKANHEDIVAIAKDIWKNSNHSEYGETFTNFMFHLITISNYCR